MLLGLRLRHDLPQPPPLQPGHGPRLLDPDAVADLRRVVFVVGVETARPLDRAGVLRVLDPPLDLDDDRLVHLVRDHAPDLGRAPLLRRRLAHWPASAFFSRARRYVLTRARSRRSTRRRLGFSSWPVDF